MTEAAAAPVVTAVTDPLARLKRELATLETKAREALKGTAVEAAATRAQALLPRDVEARLDAVLDAVIDPVLDRAGLVRKTKLAATVAAPLAVPVAAEEPAAAPVVVVAEGPACVGQVA